MTDIIQAKKTAPQGYHYTNAGVLPNEWTSRLLSSIVEGITETAGTREIETVSISAGVGFVNQAEKFGKELSGKQYEKYTVLHRGDFSYNKGNSNLYPQGCIYRLNDRTEAAVPNVFESFRVSDGNPDFYEQLFISGFLNRQLYSRINRGVRDDGLLNLRGNDFYSCEVPCPPLAEQERIAEILMQCDKIIELKQKRIAEEKKKKEALIHRLLRTSKEALHDFPLLVDRIACVPMKFIIYIDDLSFQKQDDRYASLKAVLEGGLAARPKNALIYATSNRRHLIKESFSDRDGDDMHRNDSIQESLSLSDRFGLSVNFSVPDKQRYLDIVLALAQQRGLQTDTQTLLANAERWALMRGGRSPRCARQFIDAQFTHNNNTEVTENG